MRVDLESYFPKHQKTALVAKFNKEKYKAMKLPLGLEQKNEVPPNGLLYTIFALDPIETIKGHISVNHSVRNFTMTIQKDNILSLDELSTKTWGF